MHQYIIMGSRLSFFLLFALAVPFLFNMEDILRIWLVQVPEYTPWLCRLELIYALIGTLSNTLLIGVMATGHIRKYQLVVATINMLTLPLAVLALQIYENPYIASVVMCIVAVFAFYARLAIVSQQIYLDKRIYLGNLLKMILPTVIVIILAEFYIISILPTGGLLLFLVRMTISFLICTAVIWLLGMTTSERNKVLFFARKKLHL